MMLPELQVDLLTAILNCSIYGNTCSYCLIVKSNLLGYSTSDQQYCIRRFR